MMKKWIKWVLIGLAALLVIAQFFGIDRSAPDYSPADDLIAVHTPDGEITAILRKACYDCHSYQTTYPWYSYVAPVSWLVGHDIDEGREHLNFSVWATYSAKKRDHKLEECVEEVDEGEMPLDIYTWTHADTKLTKEEKEALVTWFDSIRE